MADQPYVSFPGSAGVNIGTEAQNRLGTEDAHFAQGTGAWTVISGTFERVLEPSAFAGFAVEGTALGGGELRLICGSSGGPGGEVPGDTQITYAVTVVTDTAAQQFRTILAAYDSGGGSLGNFSFGSQYDLTPGVPYRYSVTSTTPSNTAWVALTNRMYDSGGSTTPAGAKLRLYEPCVSVGASADFVPALFVDDVTYPGAVLFEEIVPADMAITQPGSRSGSLLVGDGWAGQGVSYRRYDGADASAPLIAEFLATDVEGAV